MPASSSDVGRHAAPPDPPPVELPEWVRLACPECGAALAVSSDAACPNGHRFARRNGILQLFPHDAPRPPADYVRWIADYYRIRFTRRQNARTERLTSLFFEHTAPRTPVLDVGCGRADKARFFPAGTYVGIDPIDPVAAGMLGEVPAPMVCGTGELLPFADAQFASVILFGVLDHVRDRPALFREVARVLRPGGALCLFSQVVGEREGTVRGIASWALDRLRTGDLVGLIRVARFTLANPLARSFAEPLSAERILAELSAVFASVRRSVVEGHTLIVRAER